MRGRTIAMTDVRLAALPPKAHSRCSFLVGYECPRISMVR